MKRLRVGLAVIMMMVCTQVFAGDLFFKTKTINTSEPILFGKNISLSSIKSYSKSEKAKIKYFIVQFKTIIGEAEIASLRNQGAEILQYIPDKAFIVRSDFENIDKLSSLPNVNWIGRFDPELRADSKLLSWSLLNQNQKEKIVVSFFNSKNQAETKSNIIQAAGTLILDGKSAIVVETSRNLIPAIANIEGVEWVEKFTPMQTTEIQMEPGDEPDDAELTGLESGVSFLGLKGFYDLGLFGTTQIAGIADTGLDMGVNDDTLIADVRGRVADAQILGLWSDTWADSNGHGTHVTGSVMGNGANSNGIIKGGAPEAKLVFQSLLTGFGGLYVPPDLADLFEPSRTKGTFIHSNSWGNPAELGEYSAYSQTLDAYVFSHPEFLPVFAAGNEGVDANADGVIDLAAVIAPGTAKNALTIGASEGVVLKGGVQKMWKETRLKDKYKAEPIASDHLSDNANGLAAFSSRGPTKDGRIKPDVVAPGTNVLSLKSQHPDSEPLWGLYNQYYTFSGGTSMATPLTTGSLVILRQYLLEKLNLESVSAALLKATIINSAKDLFPGQFGDNPIKEIPVERPNMQEGWGRVDIDSILNKNIHFLDQAVGLKTREKTTLSIQATAEKPLKFTLVYSDAAGSPSAAKALVNDLDLVVIGPEGEKYSPNHLDKADRINNVEGIDIATPTAGNYTIEVSAFQVPKGPQPFALVISGEFEVL